MAEVNQDILNANLELGETRANVQISMLDVDQYFDILNTFLMSFNCRKKILLFELFQRLIVQGIDVFYKKMVHDLFATKVIENFQTLGEIMR